MVKAALERKRLKGKQTMHENKNDKQCKPSQSVYVLKKSHALKTEHVLLFGFGGSIPHETCRSEI